MNRAGLLVVLLLGAAPVWAQNLLVQSQHARRDVGTQSYLWLKTHEMMILDVSGPTQLGLRVREVLSPGRAIDPVDLTVVRDDSQQGTVRFKVGPGDEEQLSGEILVRIDVPAGRHSYRLLVSGPHQGIVLQPFSGASVAAQAAVVATPAGDQQAFATPRARKEKVRSKPGPVVPVAAEPDILAAVESDVRPERGPETFVMEHRPDARPSVLGPGTRTAATVGGALLLSAAAMSISGRVQHDRAMAADVQIRAGEYFDRSERSHQAATVMYSLAGGALVTALVLWLVEEPPAVDTGP